MIDLRSDTVTKPTPGMREAMLSAVVGDDVLGDDPTVQALETKMASDFGHEAALFCPSGTMANQIAIQLHCQRLDEVIVDKTSHIYKYETGGYAYISGAAIQALPTADGRLRPADVVSHIQPDHDWLPRTRLVSIENSCNRAGGSVYTFHEMEALAQTCRAHGLRYHLDGARLYNAMLHLGRSSHDIGPLFDTISVCLSKGLGAPIGSVLIGSRDAIYMARRLRKAMGGGMRQVGLLAAAGLYALDHHVDRLAEDHRHARALYDTLSAQSWVTNIKDQCTNVVLFQVEDGMKGRFDAVLQSAHIAISEMGEGWYRMVTHLDVTSDQIDQVCSALSAC